MKETRQEYIKRVTSVLDYIEQNLEAELYLESLSQKANYSPYHFHRVFGNTVGENLNEYIHRKRIERIASILLVSPDKRLKDLAFQYGFNSDSSFSRAFKKYYGVSPTTFKTKGENILSKIGIEFFSVENYIRSIDHLKLWTQMNAKINTVEFPALKLACISQIGTFDKAGILFQRLMEWGHERDLLDTSKFKAITLYHDNPNVTSISKVRFSAGITVSKNFRSENEIRAYTLGKGIYVIGHFEIKADEISKAWKSMNLWVIENEYEFRDGDYFEMYHNDHKTHPEQKFIIDICIPIEKTENIKLGKIETVDLSVKTKQNDTCETGQDYHQLIRYMKELKLFFQKEYGAQFKLGNVYQGNPDFSYLSITTIELQKLKLKFVIVLNHKDLSFSICLSGQNKNTRKKYWSIFKESDWNKYHLAESINDSLSIIDQIIVEKSDFTDKRKLTNQIDTASISFIEEIRGVLE